jgi:hypothetical protein
LPASLSCRKEADRPVSRLPKGDAVWFADGTGDPEIEDRLLAFSCAVVFLPARRLAPEGVSGQSKDLSAPARPFSRIPVALVISSAPGVADAVGSAGDPGALSEALWREAQAALARQKEFGPIAGIHLDLSYSPASVDALTAAASSLRKRLPAAVFLSASLRRSPLEPEREGYEQLARQVDAFVAFVLGEEERSSPVAAEALGDPWWAAYSASARGERKTGSGEARGEVPEKYLDALVSNPRLEFGHDLFLGTGSESAFTLRVRDAVRLNELALAPGEQVSFRQPALSEILFHLGADRAGRARFRGRVLVFRGSTESERLFTVAALEDVLLGRALAPDVRIETGAEGRRAVRVAAENRSPHASLISRVSNWAEIDLGQEHIADVSLGGFDRFEVFDQDGNAVSLGRATRIRFYETLVAPLERIEAARIVLRSSAPANCCRYRLRVASAAGSELATEWIAPEPSPAKDRR